MLIFLDLQTTGLEADDKICSVSLIAQDGENIVVINELIDEGKKIPPLASSIHHITNEMIKGKTEFIQSDAYNFLFLNNSTDTTLIAHNVKFDLEKLSSVGLRWKGGVIDTLRVTKHLIPECELFSLQVLRYELKLYQKEKMQREVLNIEQQVSDSSSLEHVLTTKNLFRYLLEISNLEEMLELSFKNVLIQKLEFGKHSGKYLEEIAMMDRGYLEWMLSNVNDLDEDLRYSIVYYLGENL